jgi:hypothetical protein
MPISGCWLLSLLWVLFSSCWRWQSCWRGGIEGWRRMKPHNPDPSFVERFSRRAQTKALSTLLGG